MREHPDHTPPARVGADVGQDLPAALKGAAHRDRGGTGQIREAGLTRELPQPCQKQRDPRKAGIKIEPRRLQRQLLLAPIVWAVSQWASRGPQRAMAASRSPTSTAAASSFSRDGGESSRKA